VRCWHEGIPAVDVLHVVWAGTGHTFPRQKNRPVLWTVKNVHLREEATPPISTVTHRAQVAATHRHTTWLWQAQCPFPTYNTPIDQSYLRPTKTTATSSGASIKRVLRIDPPPSRIRRTASVHDLRIA
jgi:hypothetical protein